MGKTGTTNTGQTGINSQAVANVGLSTTFSSPSASNIVEVDHFYIGRMR